MSNCLVYLWVILFVGFCPPCIYFYGCILLVSLFLFSVSVVLLFLCSPCPFFLHARFTVYNAHFSTTHLFYIYYAHFILIYWVYLGYSDWWPCGSRGCLPQDPHQDPLLLTSFGLQLLTREVGCFTILSRNVSWLVVILMCFTFLSGLSFYILFMALSFLSSPHGFVVYSLGIVFLIIFPLLDMCRS